MGEDAYQDWLCEHAACSSVDGKWCGKSDCPLAPRRGWHALNESAEKAEAALRNLLAVIHRDDGSHTAKVGIEQSVADAHQRWAALIAAKEKAEAERDAALRERDEAYRLYMRGAEAAALVLSHEGRIETLTEERDRWKAIAERNEPVMFKAAQEDDESAAALRVDLAAALAETQRLREALERLAHSGRRHMGAGNHWDACLACGEAVSTPHLSGCLIQAALSPKPTGELPALCGPGTGAPECGHAHAEAPGAKEGGGDDR